MTTKVLSKSFWISVGVVTPLPKKILTPTRMVTQDDRKTK